MSTEDGITWDVPKKTDDGITWDSPIKKERSWSNVAGSAVQNLIPSTGRAIGEIAETVMHPIDTVKNIGKLGYGAIQNALPESVVNAIGADKESQDMASNVGQFYKDRYGSMEGFKEALATDPAGILMDAGSAFTGGGAAIAIIPALSKAGFLNPIANISRGLINDGSAFTGNGSIIPTLSKVGNVVSKAGSYVDPIANVGRAAVGAKNLAGNTAAFVGGLSTGAGSEAIKEAYRSGKAGGSKAQMLADNLRGRVPMENVLADVKQNLSAMNTAKQSAYKNNMEAVKTDKSILDFTGIDKAISDSGSKVFFKGQVKNTDAGNALSSISKEINDWKALNPNEFHTPEGLDALKQKIGGIVENIPFEQKTARSIGNDIYNSIKSEITKQAPVYEKTMRDYSSASKQMQEIEKSLSVGNKASADTGMRKLQSVMRNNVNTNYGNRLGLIKALEGFGTKDVMSALAGQALNSLTPRGLQALGTTGLAALGLLSNPAALALIPATMPRVVGEASLLAGKGAGLVDKGANLIRKTPILGKTDPRILANALYQMQQPKEQRQ